MESFEDQLAVALDTGLTELSIFWEENEIDVDNLKKIPYNKLGEYGKARYQALQCQFDGKHDAAENYLELAKRLEW